MSRIGKKPIPISEVIQCTLQDGRVEIQGPKGTLVRTPHSCVRIEKQEHKIIVSVKNPEDRIQKALWGLWRVLVANMVQGVSEGFEKRLEIHGVGFRAVIEERNILLHLGFSHPVTFSLPDGIDAKVEKNIIVISGIDKEVVGETSARIRALKKPEPYKGKGIKYVDEIIRRKQGKVVKGAGK